MAQHDFNIADQNTPAFRSDLNNALGALASLNAGTSPPSTLVQGMQWLHINTPSTTLWHVKQYDGTDWIVVGSLDVANNRWNIPGSSIGQAMQWTADVTAARAIIAAAPVGGAFGGSAGTWQRFAAIDNTPLVLPAGGTWVYFAINRIWSTGIVHDVIAGVAAGGTQVAGNAPGFDWLEFAWRQT